MPPARCLDHALSATSCGPIEGFRSYSLPSRGRAGRSISQEVYPGPSPCLESSSSTASAALRGPRRPRPSVSPALGSAADSVAACPSSCPAGEADVARGPALPAAPLRGRWTECALARVICNSSERGSIVPAPFPLCTSPSHKVLLGDARPPLPILVGRNSSRSRESHRLSRDSCFSAQPPGTLLLPTASSPRPGSFRQHLLRADRPAQRISL